jgi:hypothetical protein
MKGSKKAERFISQLSDQSRESFLLLVEAYKRKLQEQGSNLLTAKTTKIPEKKLEDWESLETRKFDWKVMA